MLLEKNTTKKEQLFTHKKTNVMKNKIISALWMMLLLFTFFARAQNITQFQYFYDTDPGVGITGNGGFIAVASPADSVRILTGIPTTGLSIV